MTKILSAAALVLVTAAGFPAFAQEMAAGATLSGTIRDPSGAVRPGASVTVLNLDSNHSSETTSDAAGRFRFLSLPVGRYRLEARAPGLATLRADLTLSIGQMIDIPLRLDLSAAEVVNVGAGVPIVDARRTEIAGAVTPGDIDTLPLNGHNYLDLALLVPNVSRTNTRSADRFADVSAVPGTGISVAGQRNTANSVIVDGLSANDDAADLAGAYYGEEVIREFEVVTSGGGAEFGRASAGVVNVVTQSGSNAYRARGYGFFRDDALDARNPLAAAKDPLTQRQYGATFGGPIARDRIVVFSNVEQTRQHRTGLVTIGAAEAAAINRVLDSDGYGGPRVVPGPYGTGYDTTNVFGRIDRQETAASRLALRYSLYDIASPNARNAGGLNDVTRGQSLADRDQTAAATWVAAPSAVVFNELRLQATRSRLTAPPTDLVGPSVAISGVANWGTASVSATGRAVDLYEAADSLTLQRGAHLLKAGADLLYNRLTMLFPGQYRGLYTFASLPSFLAGRYVNYQQAFGAPDQFLSNPNLGAFVQDEWQLPANLTLNAGLRYDLQWLGHGIALDDNNLSPRIGAAWASSDRRTVVRANGGLYFDRIPLRAVSNALQRDGVGHQIAVLSFGEAAAPVFPSTRTAFPQGTLTAITTVDPGIQEPYSRQAGVQIERALGATSLSVGYQRLTGRHILMIRNINVPTLTAAAAAAQGVANLGRPDPRVANNSQFQGIGQSAFNGFTASLHLRASWLGVLGASYTLSSSFDDGGNLFFNLPQDNANPHADWGPSDNDQRHHLVVSGAIGQGPGRALPGGLEIGYLVSYATGVPFNVQTGTDRNNDTTVNDRPLGVSRNSERQPATSSVDLRLSRRFHLGSRQQLEAMVEAFNVLNHTNVLNVNNIIGTGPAPLAAFRQPTVAGDPRQIQLGGRWTF